MKIGTALDSVGDWVALRSQRRVGLEELPASAAIAGGQACWGMAAPASRRRPSK